MRPFRSKADKLLRQHLERIGVDKFWLGSAKQAVRYCEAGAYFEPVLTAAGPIAARTAVAILKLESFVEGTIDWSVTEKDSAFLVGPAEELHEQRFAEAAERWEDLYQHVRNPTVIDGSDLYLALGHLVAIVESSPSEGTVVDQLSRGGLWSLGSAGYVWRLAESHLSEWGDRQWEKPWGVSEEIVHLTPWGSRVTLAKRVEAIVASCSEEGASRDRVLAWAAAQCVLVEKIPLEHGSPGGSSTGGPFLRRAFELAERGLIRDEMKLAKADRWWAFNFGIALHDAERSLCDASSFV